ncbi:MAG: NACHT domain-containing protein [Pseudonocardiaceae bacterium]
MRRSSVLRAALVLDVLPLLLNLATNTVTTPDSWTPWVWVVTVALAIAVVLVEARNRSGGPTALMGGGTGLDAVANWLATAVGAQWRREEERRRVHDPFPLPVRWHHAPEALMDHTANVHRAPAGTTPEPLDLTGELDRIVEIYQLIPSGRLVILGQAGSGKTILALRFVVDLLDARATTDPVPVIFSLGSWNPTTTSLRDWLADQLIRDHPGLAAPGPAGDSLATALTGTGRILPILDGFDEIAQGLHRAALTELNATGMPLLVTSRPVEYIDAVAGTDVLTSAAGIELTDLTLTDLVNYLPRTTRRVTSTGTATVPVWDPVLNELRDHPHSLASVNLTAVLATPLMVVLARAIYSDTPDHNPSVLLGNFIPTVYQHQPGDHRHWDSERVQHWLGYLRPALGRRPCLVATGQHPASLIAHASGRGRGRADERARERALVGGRVRARSRTHRWARGPA